MATRAEKIAGWFKPVLDGLNQFIPGTEQNDLAARWIEQHIFPMLEDLAGSDPDFDSDEAVRAILGGGGEFGSPLARQVLEGVRKPGEAVGAYLEEDPDIAREHSYEVRRLKQFLGRADGEFEGGAGIGVPKFRDKPWEQKTAAKRFDPYTDEDVIEPTRWRSPERVGALQRDLVEAGVLEGDFQYGMFDDATADAYKALLTFANAAELPKGKALGEFRKAQRWAESQGVPWQFGGEGGSRKKFVAADPVEVRTDLRTVFRQRLGRDPKPSELAELEGAFTRYEQQSFTQQADPAQGGGTTSDRVLQQIREGRDFIDADDDAAAIAPVQSVNPMARVLNVFEERFEPEMDVAEQVEEGGTVRQSLAGTARILGGAA